MGKSKTSWSSPKAKTRDRERRLRALESGFDDSQRASSAVPSSIPFEEPVPRSELLDPSLYSMQGLPMSALENYGLIPRTPSELSGLEARRRAQPPSTTFYVKVRRELRMTISPCHTFLCKCGVPRLTHLLG